MTPKRETFSKAHVAALEYWKSTPGSNWPDVLVDHMVKAHQKLCEQMRDECAKKADEQEAEQAALARRYVRSGTLFAEHENARRTAERIATSIRSIKP